MLKDIYAEAEKKMETTLSVLQREFAGVRTGRASLGLLDGITVEYYGTATPLNQVASLSTPETSLIQIQPWDPSIVPAVEKAILASDLGLTPASDGKIVRINIPPLTEERRKQLVNHVKKLAEESRVAVRNVRREANEHTKKLLKEKKISEDEEKEGESNNQKRTDHFIKLIDQLVAAKEKEILEG
jgi:ribosome recycling factor